MQSQNLVSHSELVRHAIIGLQVSLERLKVSNPKEFALATESMTDEVTDVPVATTEASGKKRQMSTAARKRIAAAQKKRWAEYHRQKEAGE